MIENPGIMSTRRFAEHFNVKLGVLHKAIVSGTVPAFRVGTLYRIKVDEVPEQVIERLRQPRRRKPILPDGMKVYFIGASNGPIKIGLSRDPVTRLARLSTSSPVALTLLAWNFGGRSTEADYHHRFNLHRLNGEWFNPHPEILAEIDRLSRIQDMRAATET